MNGLSSPATPSADLTSRSRKERAHHGGGGDIEAPAFSNAASIPASCRELRAPAPFEVWRLRENAIARVVRGGENAGAHPAFAALIGERPDDPLAQCHLKRLLNGQSDARIEAP